MRHVLKQGAFPDLELWFIAIIGNELQICSHDLRNKLYQLAVMAGINAVSFMRVPGGLNCCLSGDVGGRVWSRA